MSRATDELFDVLHGMTAQQMIDEIHAYRNGERFHPQKYDKDGEPLPREPMSIPPAMFTAIIKFLKDNGIDRPGRDENEEDTLNDLLPDLESVVNFPGRQ